MKYIAELFVGKNREVCIEASNKIAVIKTIIPYLYVYSECEETVTVKIKDREEKNV